MGDNLTGVLVVFVVIGIPVISVFTVGAFKQWLRFQERKIEILGAKGNAKIDDAAIGQLRDEIMSVRHVANEYDLSIQHTLDEIQRRLDGIELRISQPTYSGERAAEPVDQIVAGRKSAN